MANKKIEGRASEAILNQLHSAVASDLLKRVRSGDATAQELNAAIKYLKDNGIEAERGAGGEMDELAKAVLSTNFEDSEDEYVN